MKLWTSCKDLLFQMYSPVGSTAYVWVKYDGHHLRLARFSLFVKTVKGVFLRRVITVLCALELSDCRDLQGRLPNLPGSPSLIHAS